MFRFTGLIMAAFFLISLSSCSSVPKKNNNLIAEKTREMLNNYRGKAGLKVAIVKAGDVGENSEAVETDIINTVFQSVFDDGRFVIVERELLRKVLDEVSLQQSGLVSENKISEIGKLSGAHLVFIVRQNVNLIDMRIISVDTGEVLAFTSFSKKEDREALSNYEKLKQKYLDEDCPGQTRQDREIIIAGFNSYPEEKREFYLLSMIQSCKEKVENLKKQADFAAKAKELNLDKKTAKELEEMFIEKDTTRYPSRAARKLIIAQYREAFLGDAAKKNPSMEEYYKDLYNEQLIKLIVEE